MCDFLEHWLDRLTHLNQKAQLQRQKDSLEAAMTNEEDDTPAIDKAIAQWRAEGHKGQLCWKIPGAEKPHLHMRNHPYERWRPYQSFPHVGVQRNALFTPGFSEFCHYRALGWELVTYGVENV